MKLFSKKGLTKGKSCGIIGEYEKSVHVALAQLDRVFGYEPKGRGFESLMPRQIRTQNRIQEIVPNLRFLLLFRGIFPFLSINKPIFPRLAATSDDGLFSIIKFVVKIRFMVKIKIIVYGL